MKYLAHYIAYYGSVLLPIIVSALLFFTIPQSSHRSTVLSIVKVLWFASGLYVAANVLGFITGSPWHHERRNHVTWDISKHLRLVYVSRGQNDKALARAITASRKVLDASGIPYSIEAITDIPVTVGADQHVIVPAAYATIKGAKYKARALHYASVQRAASIDTWLLHMDEESMITQAAIQGIAKFIASGDIIRIGQGEIQYNGHGYGKNFLITAADAVRTGDDLGRFRLQYALFKRPLFGMHGSYFVVHSLVEKRIGFDLGGRGSITEDAYFALKCSQRGVKFDWINGSIREQSPFTIGDLLKQRRRWMNGLQLLIMDKTVSLKQRFPLGLALILSQIAWLGLMVTIYNFFSGGSHIPFVLAYIAELMAGSIVSVYLVGAYRNVASADIPVWHKVLIWIYSGLLVPVSCLIEAVAIIYAVTRPVQDFQIVAKN